jgi:hypothetical protein
VRGQGISAAIRGEQVSDETRARAAARLRYLWWWEAANVLLLPTLALLLLRSNRSELGLPSASGLALCSAELAIGSAYWHLKLRQLTAGTMEQPLPGLQWFRLARNVMAVLLALGAPAWLVPAVRGVGDVGVAIGAAAWTLALLEHVNYFHRQLMHDTRADVRRLLSTRRLRRSFLALDLARADQRGTS